MRPTFRIQSTLQPPDKSSSGFTIVELIVVITILAIVASLASTFIARPTQTYFDIEIKANLSDRADNALRRMAREIRNALPNSVRVTSNGADSLIEFIPIQAAGRYRADVGNASTDNPLDFNASTDTFDVLGPAVTVSSGDKLVIYNLGVAGADAYAGSNIRPLSTTGTLNSLGFSGGTFPFPSPASRFFVVSTATSFACDLTNRRLLMYSNYPIPVSQPSSIAALNALTTARLLANNVTGCQISYGSGIQQRNGIITINLVLSQDTANVRLMHQINVVNTP